MRRTKRHTDRNILTDCLSDGHGEQAIIKTGTWLLLLGIVLLVSILAAFLLRSSNDPTGAAAKIYLDNECIHTIALSDVSAPYTIPVTGKNGTNIISVESGRIRVSEADCPDQICVNRGWLSSGITPIVCLPNKLVIQIEQPKTTDEAFPDGVVQ